MAATAAAAEAKADRLARELEEAEEEISAMSSKMRQQVGCLKGFCHFSFALHVATCCSSALAHCTANS